MRKSAHLLTSLVVGSLGLACSGSDRLDHPATVELQALTVAIDLAAPAVGEHVIASVKGRYADGAEKDVTAGLTWRSSNAAVLEPVAEAPGHYLAKSKGFAQILVSSGDVNASASVNVSDAKVVSMEIVPSAKTIGLGGQLRVNVLATYTDGTRETVTKNVEWTTSAAGVLLPSSTDMGYLVTFGQGNATITASLEGVSATGEYTVGPARIDYIVVSPQNARIDATHPVQYSAMGHWTDGRYVDVSNMVTWSSSDPAVATIDANGLATVAGDGSVVITARIDDIEAVAAARTVSQNCPYPAEAADRIAYNTVMPPVFWLDALDQSGATADYQLADRYCDATTHPVVIFVVVAGWCPHCPDYMRMVDSKHAELEAAGAEVIYVTIETAAGGPANNEQSHALVNRETPSEGRSWRVGDGVTAGIAALPFSAAVETVPNAFVVRTRDMRVIAFQGQSDSLLDFVTIANNPERLY